jgi:peptidyl-prolyl cis-trans isomerase B (cyclophilin B)
MKKIIFTFLSMCIACTMFAQSGTTKSKNSKAPATVTKQEPLTVKPTKMDTSKYVLISTEYGDIKIRLYDETPLHRDNFVKLAKQGFFDSTLFHRIIPAFMIQGGDPNSKNAAPGQPLGMGDVGYRIPAEFNKNLIHKRGVLAAARDGNPQKASSGCQFYITQGRTWSDDELNSFEMRNGIKYTPEQRKIYKEIGGTAMLDMNYTVYGEVVSGMDVVDKIIMQPRDANDRPNKDIRMTVKVLE